MYLVLNSQKRVQFIKRPFVLLYKGYKSSANYDGEPSVSKGIVSQLPSSHLLIHRVLAKLSNRVIALRSKLLQATALVCILILLTCPFHRVRIFRGRITLFLYLLVIVLMQCLLHSIVIGFLSRTLPDFGIIRNPARLWNK